MVSLTATKLTNWKTFMSNLQRVGLLGAGLMGHGIGKNILKHGYPPGILAHRNRIPIESLLEMVLSKRQYAG